MNSVSRLYEYVDEIKTRAKPTLHTDLTILRDYVLDKTFEHEAENMETSLFNDLTLKQVRQYNRLCYMRRFDDDIAFDRIHSGEAFSYLHAIYTFCAEHDIDISVREDNDGLSQPLASIPFLRNDVKGLHYGIPRIICNNDGGFFLDDETHQPFLPLSIPRIHADEFYALHYMFDLAKLKELMLALINEQAYQYTVALNEGERNSSQIEMIEVLLHSCVELMNECKTYIEDRVPFLMEI